MKTKFITPEIKFVMLDSSDLICTSGGFEGIRESENGDNEARGRRNTIWDD